MKETIISLLSMVMDYSWAEAMITFIDANETNLLSNQSGHYTVGDLSAELKIRSESAEVAGVESMGMIELQNALATLKNDQPIRNYIFKGEGKTGIVYLDVKAEKLIGAVLIKTA